MTPTWLHKVWHCYSRQFDLLERINLPLSIHLVLFLPLSLSLCPVTMTTDKSYGASTCAWHRRGDKHTHTPDNVSTFTLPAESTSFRYLCFVFPHSVIVLLTSTYFPSLTGWLWRWSNNWTQQKPKHWNAHPYLWFLVWTTLYRRIPKSGSHWSVRRRESGIYAVTSCPGTVNRFAWHISTNVLLSWPPVVSQY